MHSSKHSLALFASFLLMAAGVGFWIGRTTPPSQLLAAQGGFSNPQGPIPADLQDQEKHQIALFEKAAPSTVFINTTTTRYNYWSGEGVEVPAGTGSGFVYDDKGHIVTNYHVVRQAKTCSVVFGDGTEKTAKLVGVSPRHDLAVLEVESVPAPAIAVGTSRDLRVGQSVFAIGNPFGLDHTLTTGIVSALNRQIRGESGQVIEGAIQTDAAINPGNSGGPLLDSRGKLIGINTAIYSPSGASAGIGFAIPVDTVSRVVPQLIEKGEYVPPRLGIGLIRNPRWVVSLQQSAHVEGLPFASTDPQLGAAAAGLKPTLINNHGLVTLGDFILAVNGRKVSDDDSLLRALDACKAGTMAKVRIWRDGKEMDVEVEVK